MEELEKEQIEDEVICQVYSCVQEKKRLSEKELKTWPRKSQVIPSVSRFDVGE